MSTVQNHFLWTMKSTMPSSNFGYRSDGEKIFDRIAPVQIQVASNDDRKHLVRLTVEYVQAGIATSSFRKVYDFIWQQNCWYCIKHDIVNCWGHFRGCLMLFRFYTFAPGTSYGDHWWGRSICFLHTTNDGRGLFCVEIAAGLAGWFFFFPLQVCSACWTLHSRIRDRLSKVILLQLHFNWMLVLCIFLLAGFWSSCVQLLKCQNLIISSRLLKQTHSSICVTFH